MRFIVTGATSMIGCAFVSAAIKEGHDIIALVRKNSKNISRLPKSKCISIVYSDLDNFESIELERLEYDVFYHFAWDYTSRDGRNNIDGQAHNIRLCLNSVKLASKYNCKKFVGAGSQSEYGYVEGIIDENTPLNPQMPYAMAKAASYWLSKSLCNQLEITHIWGRIFSVYGNNDHEGTLLLYAIDSFINKKTAIFSSGNQIWNFLHEADAGKMFMKLSDDDVKAGVYLIANNESKPLKEYLRKVIELFEEPVDYCFLENDEKMVYSIQPDMKKTSNTLNYVPEVHFEDGIRQLINYRKEIYKNELSKNV